ncbi:formate--tetrahydrofolate ligase [Spiroplasma turonicum]|uniref:Formate--tetrahydrofolate ligase n=1 Tax=Spiroplasma turonicum TaxID=216946 RepID=A0A0K1P8I6_9MOLU|nr:formate--tetrahydrofolate ligase [Spiroplasma turonicum]AKU80217.1 formate--tetrahydrofolate ligase [Spiroplasma turonicum]ALX71217.1 formate--tetrahydrofolate ligase [Spiroplasma turonicum]
MEKFKEIFRSLNLNDNDLTLYGNNVAKVNTTNFNNKKQGKLILMTSINPTPAGEGKTTTAIGLADGLNLINKKAILALREPSMGPVFGRKGTATGGGESEVVPVDDINLNFTGDIHAITSANNLISATIDSELYWKSSLNIDPTKVIWKRCVDLNDRALRDVEIKISKTITRKEQFTITAASNIMTILSLSTSVEDLRLRLENSLVAYTFDNKEVFIKDLNIVGSLMVILKDAIKPNLVVTKYKTPTLIHCGPFANIATGTNSIISTNLGLSLGEYCIVESGFGSDLGFEKFMNVINYSNDLIPSCVVMVVTIRALLLHDDFNNNFKHLDQHLKHVKLYNLNLVVAINFIKGDDVNNLNSLKEWLTNNNYDFEINEAYTKGAEGAKNLAILVDKLSNKKADFKKLINNNDSLELKIEKVIKNFYYLNEFSFSNKALDKLNEINNSDYKYYPICMVKSFASIDGNDSNQSNYKMEIKNLEVNTGAKFIVVYTNQVMSMPGLNKEPNSKEIDLINNVVVGLK